MFGDSPLGAGLEGVNLTKLGDVTLQNQGSSRKTLWPGVSLPRGRSGHDALL